MNKPSLTLKKIRQGAASVSPADQNTMSPMGMSSMLYEYAAKVVVLVGYAAIRYNATRKK